MPDKAEEGERSSATPTDDNAVWRKKGAKDGCSGLWEQALISENYWKPFHRGRKHRMYSVSKSWVSLAVGIMADEGHIVLDDPVARFFPEYLPGIPHEFITRATIRDMLRMTDCHDTVPYGFSDNNWVKTWFDTPPTHPPGTIFSYNTVCTNICCAIVEKLSGMPFIEYLYPRVLAPVGASDGIACIQSPEGYSFGGSGVLCTPLDLARVAQLCMNGGRWGGRQLISERYIREATAWQADTTLTTSDINEQQGYGYQFWRTRHNGFACYSHSTPKRAQRSVRFFRKTRSRKEA